MNISSRYAKQLRCFFCFYFPSFLLIKYHIRKAAFKCLNIKHFFSVSKILSQVAISPIIKIFQIFFKNIFVRWLHIA